MVIQLSPDVPPRTPRQTINNQRIRLGIFIEREGLRTREETPMEEGGRVIEQHLNERSET